MWTVSKVKIHKLNTNEIWSTPSSQRAWSFQEIRPLQGDKLCKEGVMFLNNWKITMIRILQSSQEGGWQFGSEATVGERDWRHTQAWIGSTCHWTIWTMQFESQSSPRLTQSACLQQQQNCQIVWCTMALCFDTWQLCFRGSLGRGTHCSHVTGSIEWSHACWRVTSFWLLQGASDNASWPKNCKQCPFPCWTHTKLDPTHKSNKCTNQTNNCIKNQQTSQIDPPTDQSHHWLCATAGKQLQEVPPQPLENNCSNHLTIVLTSRVKRTTCFEITFAPMYLS